MPIIKFDFLIVLQMSEPFGEPRTNGKRFTKTIIFHGYLPALTNSFHLKIRGSPINRELEVSYLKLVKLLQLNQKLK